MTTEVLDHLAQSRSRIATQYREAVKLLSIVERKAIIYQEFEDIFKYFYRLLDIDDMEGHNLDVIGDIVGISREIDMAILLPFFGFSDTPQGQNFGEEEDPSIGARFWNGEPEAYAETSSLGDPEYRLLIRSKIVKNHSIGTNDDVLKSLTYLFPNTMVVIEDLGGMEFRVGIGRPLTYIEKLLIKELDLLPRPNGVNLKGAITYFQEDNYFGFDDQIKAKGFDDSTDSGIFAEEF